MTELGRIKTLNNKPPAPSDLSRSLPWWQRRLFTIGIAIVSLLLILAVMTFNITKYENHLSTGNTVLLQLAPIDPRGFMQGDYMTLRYALENEVFAALDRDPGSYPTNEEGYVIITVDDNQVGRFLRLAKNNHPNTLATDEMAIFYRIRLGTLKLATNAFFFQEGHAEAFEAAEYGLFRVNDKGEPLLTDMVDKDFVIIAGAASQDDES